jgi:hypothetical protein
MKRLIPVVLVSVVGVACGTAWSLGWLPTRVDDLQFVSVEPFHADGERDNLHLRFRANENLRRLTEHSGAFGAYANISLCPFHANPWVSVGRVKHNGVDLDTKPTRVCTWNKGKYAGCETQNDTPDVRKETASVDTAQGPFIYDVYFTYYEQWLTYTNGGTTQRRIPLPSEPQDLCVRVHGDGSPPGLQSNVFVIPKAELVRALGASKIPPLAPTAWNSDPNRLRCEPSTSTLGQNLTLKLGPKHGSELAVHRLSDDTWFVVVTGSPPSDMHSLMTPREYASTTQLVLPPHVTGYKWWASDSGQQQIFTSAGDYDIYSSDNIESNTPGLGCSIKLSNPPT